MVVINNRTYNVSADEYEPIKHQEYNNLKLYKDLALHERVIGLIAKCATLGKPYFFSFHTTHGGFIPIQLDSVFNSIYLDDTDDSQLDIIDKNIARLKTKNVKEGFLGGNDFDIIYIETMKYPTIQTYLDVTGSKTWIIITNEKLEVDNCIRVNLSDTNIWIYVDNMLCAEFYETFRFYMEVGGDVLRFDNLINLCIMVKNGGPQFEQMLIDNMHIIDKWTILDTGSTDGTVDVIKRVLIGKKEGNLYEEPFINFRDSRNRLLDLAGTSCKYNLMLDDTYVIRGDLRRFLTEIRSDQYATSFTLFIHSDDTKYGSNRVVKSSSGLQYIYRIHEVISDKNNINVVIPEKDAHIEDRRFDYMEERTQNRKQLDLLFLQQELEDDINNPRTYYYLAQTYNCLQDYEKAYYYFMKRCEFTNSGFIQERVDAAFEAARTANFKLNYSWDLCEKLYQNAFKIDESRPEPLYFIGIHYYLEGNMNKAYDYLKRGFEIGFPAHCQYSLKPTLSYHFLPKFLTRVCYTKEDYLLGEKVSEFFLLNNPSTADDYQEIASWHNIFKKLNVYQGPKIPQVSEKPIFCFVADGGFHPWSGSNILTTGVGGSETYIIEMARHIQKNSQFDVYVFCNTPWGSTAHSETACEMFEGVTYMHLNAYYKFVNTHYIKHVIVSRFSEYLPLSFKGFTENVYLVAHDLTPSGVVIPMDRKLKKVFCLTEWHVGYLTNIFKDLSTITVPFYYGIDDRFKIPSASGLDATTAEQPVKIKNKFIYSSFPNRGLLQLLQMWPRIYERHPTSTLHIYADVNHKWSNDVEPEKMAAIRYLLELYKSPENGMGIHYHGWVPKQELAESWKTADIWFYPCTFMETFCLTALEAASSRTLCVTNHLAALQNTVGDRGVIVDGDATTEEWQHRALDKLFEIMDEVNVDKKQELIKINYKWANDLSWESQAKRMLSEHIYPNDPFEYKGMYNWTHDLPAGSKDIFLKILSYFNENYHKVRSGKQVSVLEIGTYAGMSLINILKFIPNSVGTGVDMWSNYNENPLLGVIDNYHVKDSFHRNVSMAGMSDRIQGIQQDSASALIEFIKMNKKFDFIYVDGSHLLLDCYADLVLSWEVLEIGGIMAVDDYFYKKDEENILNSPYESVNHFMTVFRGKFNALNIGYRVFLEKIA